MRQGSSNLSLPPGGPYHSSDNFPLPVIVRRGKDLIENCCVS